MQPVAKIVQHHALLAPEHANRPGLPDRLHVGDAQLLAPVAGGRLESELLGRRACGKKDDIVIGRTDSRLKWRATVGRHQPVAHSSDPSAGRSHDLAVITSDEFGPVNADPVDLGTHRNGDRVSEKFGNQLAVAASEAIAGERRLQRPVTAVLGGVGHFVGLGADRAPPEHVDLVRVGAEVRPLITETEQPVYIVRTGNVRIRHPVNKARDNRSTAGQVRLDHARRYCLVKERARRNRPWPLADLAHPVPCALTCCASVYCAMTSGQILGTRIIAGCVLASLARRVCAGRKATADSARGVGAGTLQ